MKSYWLLRVDLHRPLLGVVDILCAGFVCDHNDLLAVTFKQVFSVTMLRNRT